MTSTSVVERTADISAVIARQIRALIARGALSSGVHLGQSELAERFSASRVPVREALKLLAAEGVVSHDLNRGFFVAEISGEEARQLYRIRHLLEAELLSTIDWPTPPQLADFQRLVTEMETALEEQKHEQWARLHRDFHSTIFALSPHQVLVREVRRLWSLTDRYRSLLPAPQARTSSADQAADEEHRLLDALAKRDRKRLLKVFEEDRNQIERKLLDILESRGLSRASAPTRRWAAAGQL